MKPIYLAMAGVMALSGCASIIRGTKTDFKVESTPAGAQVSLSTGEKCDATPCTIRRPRKAAFAATVSAPGYKPSVTNVQNHWSKGGTTTGIVGNAILGGIIGFGVDASTGAMHDLYPNPLIVTLEAEAAPAVAAVEPAPATAELTVATTTDAAAAAIVPAAATPEAPAPQ